VIERSEAREQPGPAGFIGPVGLLAVVLVLAAALAGVLLFGGERGAYPRLAHDHDELMVSRTARPATMLTVLFVGNSLTFVNDTPAMLVNLASSDPGDTVKLQVKGVTFPDASLDDMWNKGQAMDWARAHRPTYVVLQEHSFWYDGFYETTRAVVGRWTEALKPLGVQPLLFQVWTDGAASDVWKGGSTPAGDAQAGADGTGRLGGELGLPVVAVGQAFEAARTTPGAPDLYGPDHHHPSVAGTYLSALVFYRFLTGRSGAEATYLPQGLSQADAALLVRLNGG
jgi:hypothetical protein